MQQQPAPSCLPTENYTDHNLKAPMSHRAVGQSSIHLLHHTPTIWQVLDTADDHEYCAPAHIGGFISDLILVQQVLDVEIKAIPS